MYTLPLIWLNLIETLNKSHMDKMNEHWAIIASMLGQRRRPSKRRAHHNGPVTLGRTDKNEHIQDIRDKLALRSMLPCIKHFSNLDIP